MSHSTHSSFRLTDVVGVLRAYPRRWIVPAMTVALLATAFACCSRASGRPRRPACAQRSGFDRDGAGPVKDVEEMKVSKKPSLR